jgi:ketosteroid isomerase-like protein
VKLVILLVFLILTADRAVPQTDAEASAKSKVAALEQVWNQAYKSGDTTALASILDDAIVLVNDDGSVQTKEEFLTSVKMLVSQPRSQQQQVTPESLNVHLFGDVAVATGVMRVKGVERGKSYSRARAFR